MHRTKKHIGPTFIPVLLAILLSTCRQNQNGLHFVPTQELGKEAMYQDYDTLVSLIEEINPQLSVRKEVTGFDILEQLEKLRSAIDTCSTGQFYDIVRQALMLCQDGHSNILPSFYLEDPDFIQSAMADSLSKEGLFCSSEYIAYLDSMAGLKKLKLPMQYVDGRYLLVTDFNYQDKFFHKGTELVQCNDRETHSFVESLLSQKFLRWDFNNKRFYHEDFLSAINLIRNQKVKLTFRNPDGTLTSSLFNLYDHLDMEETGNPFSEDKAVHYFDSLRFLYIRVPMMAIDDTTFYIDEIIKYQHQSIDKVAIDIRNNGGGSDLVGEKIIELLIDQWFYSKITLLSNLSTKVAAYLNQDISFAETIDMPFLNSSKYWNILQYYKNVFPDWRSIRFDGPIYIIQNENIYSAAGTLAAYSEYSDKIFSVGTPTGRLLGKGTTPMIFELPNSHLLFRLEPLVDMSNVTTAEKVYHDHVEIPVLTSIDYYGQRFGKNNLPGSTMDLILNDLFVKTVLEHCPLDKPSIRQSSMD